jgi:hypothetical protein
MIPAILELQRKIEELQRNMPLLLQEVFFDLREVAEDLVTKKLSHGQRADGQFLPDYSPVSVTVFGKRPGPMTLEDTGDFYRGIALQVHDDGIEILGTDIKTDMLVYHYGEEILGLSEESLADLCDNYVIPLLRERVLKFLTQ